MDVAVTCISHDLLRSVASLAARHAGYRVIDSATVADAIAKSKRNRPNLMLIGMIADPLGELVNWCNDEHIPYRIISPEMPIAELGRILEGIRTHLSAT